MTEKKVRKGLKDSSIALRAASGVLMGALSVALVLFGLKFTSPSYVPGIIFGAFVLGVIIYGTIVFFMSKKAVTAVISIAISVILTVLLLAGYNTLNRSLKAINKVTEASDIEFLEVTVFVKSEDGINGIAELADKKVGYFPDDEHSLEMMDDIKAATDNSAVFVESDGKVALVESLLKGEADAIILNDSFVDILSEQPGYENVGDKLKGIYTKEIGIEREIIIPEVTVEKEEEDSFEDVKLTAGEDEFIVYVSGIDKWGSIYTRSRSDVNILAAVNAKTGRVQLINTPRDYYVYLPLQGANDKLTHAGLYGIDSSKAALEELYGVHIDYYIRMNFSGFEKIIDSLGGIDVYSEYDFTVDPIKHYTVGYNHLTGLEALAFARERYAFAAGDVQRGNNQMAVINAVIDKMTSPAILKNFDEVLDGVEDTVSTDMPADMIYNLLAYRISQGTDWKIDNYTVTGRGENLTTYSIPDMPVYVMMPNEDNVSEAVRLMESVLSE